MSTATVGATGSAASGTPMLELRGVNAGYGPFRAIFDVSLTVPKGSVLAVLGPNGAGKTTIARVATGLVAPTDGSVLIDGKDVTNRPTYEYARMGVAHAPEGRSVFATLTVAENLELPLRRTRSRAETETEMQRAFDMFPRLGERRKQLAGTLSGGEQRMLSLARAIVEDAQLVVADELSLGLAPIIVDEVYGMLGRIRDQGATLLIIEQHVGHALAIADSVIILDRGAIGFVGSPEGARGELGLATS
ncbi:MAG TPA: ABC transporter ATP-binding protein [Acidimicrobiia bacterium]